MDSYVEVSLNVTCPKMRDELDTTVQAEKESLKLLKMLKTKDKLLHVKKFRRAHWQYSVHMLLRKTGRIYIIFPVVTWELPQTHVGRANSAGAANDAKLAKTDNMESLRGRSLLRKCVPESCCISLLTPHVSGCNCLLETVRTECWEAGPGGNHKDFLWGK